MGPSASMGKSHYYRSQRSCGKVMVLHLSVILFTGRVSAQGGCLPRGGVADTPPPRARGRHSLLPSPCWDTHTPAQCMLDYTPPCAVHTVNKRAVRILLEYILVTTVALCCYRPPTKLQEGNVFTGVCSSFCSQGWTMGTQPWGE